MATQAEIEAIIKLRDELSAKIQAMGKRLDELAEKKRKVQTTTEKLKKGFTDLGSELTGLSPRMFTIAGGIAAVGVGMALAVRNVVQMGDRITNLARQFQMSTDAVQRLEAGGRGLGISFETLGQESNFLAKTLGSRSEGVLKALDELGLSYTLLSQMSPEKRLLEVHRALLQIKDPLKQAAVGSELLGRNFQKMNETDLAAFEKEMNTAIIASKDALDAGDKLGDAWDKLKASAGALAAEGLSPLVSWLAEVVDNLNFAIERFRLFNKEIDEGQHKWLKAFKDMATASSLFAAPFEAGFKFGQGPQAGKPSGFVGPPIPPGLRERSAAARDAEIRAEERANKVREDAAKNAEKLRKQEADEILRLSNLHLQASIDAWNYWNNAFDKIQQAALNADIESALQGFGPLGFSGGEGIPVGGRFVGMALSDRAPAVDFSAVGQKAEEANASIFDLSNSLADLAHMSDILGPKLASVFGGLQSAIAGFGSISGGIGSIKGGGFMNILSGIGGIAAGIGGIVGPLIALFKGIGGPDIGRDVERDIGANISKTLEKAIEESGLSAQLFLKEIFAEGALSIDRFTEETADLLSMLEQGRLSESEATRELLENIPIIVEHFGELGETGREQLERLLSAADAAGIGLGEVGGQLRRMLAGIPELTEEAFAAMHDLTQEQVDALEKILDIDLDTQIERLASQFNVPAELMETLADKMAELGLDVADLPDLLAQLGIGFEKFFEDLTGMELPEGAGVPADGMTPEGALDPVVFGDAAGYAIAGQLLPAQKQMADDFALVRGSVGELPDAIARAVADAVVRATG